MLPMAGPQMPSITGQQAGTRPQAGTAAGTGTGTGQPKGPKPRPQSPNGPKIPKGPKKRNIACLAKDMANQARADRSSRACFVKAGKKKEVNIINITGYCLILTLP